MNETDKARWAADLKNKYGLPMVEDDLTDNEEWEAVDAVMAEVYG